MKLFIKGSYGFAILAAAMVLTACGGSNIFSSVDFSKYTQDNDQYISVTADVDPKGVNLGNQTLPITSGGVSVGTVTLSTNATTDMSSLVVDLDVTKVLALPQPTANQLLPNGLAWPLSGVSLSGMESFDVGSGGSQVYYLQNSSNQTLLGVAINIDQLKVGTAANSFTSFNSNGMTGIAGVYTGQAAGSSGVGVLVNLSSVMGAKALPMIAEPSKASAHELTQIYQELMDLRAKHTLITVH